MHGLLLVGAIWFAHPVRQDDLVSLQSLAVSIVSMQTVSDSTTTAQSDATETMVATGSVSPDNPDPVEPVQPVTVKTETAVAAEPIAAETTARSRPVPVSTMAAIQPARPVEAISVEAQPINVVAAENTRPAQAVAVIDEQPVLAISADEPQAVQAVTLPPAQAQLTATAPVIWSIAPAASVQQIAPPAAVMPVDPEAPAQPLSPTPPDAIETEPLRAARPVQPLTTKPQPSPRTHEHTPRRSLAQSGSGGRSQASAQAAPAARGGAGTLAQQGNAAETRYPGLVLGALRRALRRPSDGGFGEVQVAFTVLPGGGVTSVRVVSSSGSPLLDQAALDTVRRAAPLPPIPQGAGRTSWPFVVPLQFRR